MTLYDALNEQYLAAEKKLKELRTPHPVWIGPITNTGFHLGLCKVANQWRLCVAYMDAEPKPIVDCPIKTRVQCCRYVRVLHNAILQAKEDFTPVVEDAVKAVESYVKEAT